MFASKINRTFEIRRNVRTAPEPKVLYHRIIPIVASILFPSSLPIKVVELRSKTNTRIIHRLSFQISSVRKEKRRFLVQRATVRFIATFR